VADHSVTLRFPASSERVRLARTMVAVLADEAGFDYDDVEDLRIAVDELCFALIDSCGPEASVELTADTEPGVVEVQGVCVGDIAPPAERSAPSEITRQILATVIDSYELVLDGDEPCFRFVKNKP
jgi:hypothetical protein